MEIFEKIGDTIVSAGKDVTEKAKELSSVAKLKMDIRAKEDFVEKQYALIGKKYYEAHKDDDILDYEECNVIEEALSAISDMKTQLMNLKGAKKCPNCGAEIELDRAVIEEDRNVLVCPNCKEEIKIEWLDDCEGDCCGCGCSCGEEEAAEEDGEE